MLHIKAYPPDGTTRAVWSKPFAVTWRAHKVLPERGTCVRAITTGTKRGYFEVDFSPLARLTGDEKYNFIFGAFETHEEAVAYERDWLIKNWVITW